MSTLAIKSQAEKQQTHFNTAIGNPSTPTAERKIQKQNLSHLGISRKESPREGALGWPHKKANLYLGFNLPEPSQQAERSRQMNTCMHRLAQQSGQAPSGKSLELSSD